MADTKRVRFLQTRIVKDPSGQTFEEGQEYDLVPTSADRWIQRGHAVEVPSNGSASMQANASASEEKSTDLFVDPLGPKHIGFGKYDVLDANGKKANSEPFSKADAEALAALGADVLNKNNEIEN